MLKLLKKKIGIIGFGNMGQSIAGEIRSKYAVRVFEKDASKTKGLTGITVAADFSQLFKQTQAVILAIKPQDFEPVLTEIKDKVQDQLIISIAAGITTEYIEKKLAHVRLVRVMPNLAVKVGQSTTAICKGAFASDQDVKFVAGLFKYLGTVFIFSEDKMNAATAISGSGPAYIFYDLEIKKINCPRIPKIFKDEYIKRLKAAALAVGFDEDIALRLAIGTLASAVGLLAGTGNSPAQLRKMVTSAGGTTEAAIKILMINGSWPQAALAAKQRAQELSKK